MSEKKMQPGRRQAGEKAQPATVPPIRSHSARRVLGLAIFLISVGFAVSRHPPAQYENLVPLLAVPLAITPTIVFLNALEYRIMARQAGQTVGLFGSLRTSVLASLANFLPLPGAALVKLGGLKRLGSSSTAALRSTLLISMSWLATAMVVGALSIQWRQGGPLVAILLVGALLPLAAALAVCSVKDARMAAFATLAKLLSLNAATLCLKATSYFLVLQALGAGGSPADSLTLTLAPLLAQAVGFLPAGLGLQELLAGAIGASIGMSAASAILASAVDRLLTLVTLGALQGLMLLRGAGPDAVPDRAEVSLDEGALSERSHDAHILVLASTFPKQPGDGTPEFVLSLALALQDDFRLTILVPRRPGAPAKQTIERLKVHRFPYFFGRWETLTQGAILRNLTMHPLRWLQVPLFLSSFLIHAVGLCLQRKPDVVHAHWIVPSGLIALCLKKLLRIPYVLTAHGTDVHGLQAPSFSWMKRVIVRNAHTVTPGSAEMGRLLGLEEEELERLVAPMGVDAKGIARKVGSRTPEAGRFLYVGRLVESKGVDVFLRALRLVEGGKAIIAGDGGDRQALEKLTESLSLAGRVEFLGQADRDRLVKELRLAAAVVIPTSGTEGTAQVMSEAMAAGVPVIASEVGGLAERIAQGINGTLVKAGSVESLQVALRAALSDPDSLQRLAERAQRDIVGSALDIETTARKYRDFFVAATQNSSQ